MALVLLQRVTLTGSAASVTLSNIPQTYKTLRLVVSTRTDRATIDDTLALAFNGSSANFSGRYLAGSGAAASSYSYSTGQAVQAGGASMTSNTFSNTIIDIPNYAGSAYKPVSSDSVNENNGSTAYQVMFATLWSNAAAITSLTLTSIFSSNLVSGSTFTLYGLK